MTTAADPNKARAAIDPIVPIAVVAGAALSLLTNAVSNTDVGGPGWTLRGNGSLAVLFAGGGALLAFGWLALAFGARGERGYLKAAITGAATVLALELAFSFGPVLYATWFASAVAPWQLLNLQMAPVPPFLFALIVLSLAVALAVGVLLAKGALLAGASVAVIALAASLAPLGLQFFLVPLFLPVVVAVPSLSRAANGWLLLNSFAMFVALLVGLYGAQTLASR